jgi:nucleoside 2-deoxyribosyltransferase
MKITVCSSMTFIDHVKKVAQELTNRGFAVEFPSPEGVQFLDTTTEAEKVTAKRKLADDHFARIRESDAILVVNDEKNGVAGHVGASAMLEIGAARILNVPVYLLNEPAKSAANYDELMANCEIMYDDLSKIKEEK